MNMPKDKIQAKYLTLHDALGTRSDADDKELFDQQHDSIWVDCSAELLARKEELLTKETLTAKQEKELVELEQMFPSPLEPTPDELRAKEIIEGNPEVIPQTEVWELLRIICRKLFP